MLVVLWNALRFTSHGEHLKKKHTEAVDNIMSTINRGGGGGVQESPRPSGKQTVFCTSVSYYPLTLREKEKDIFSFSQIC